MSPKQNKYNNRVDSLQSRLKQNLISRTVPSISVSLYIHNTSWAALFVSSGLQLLCWSGQPKRHTYSVQPQQVVPLFHCSGSDDGGGGCYMAAIYLQMYNFLVAVGDAEQTPLAKSNKIGIDSVWWTGTVVTDWHISLRGKRDTAYWLGLLAYSKTQKSKLAQWGGLSWDEKARHHACLMHSKRLLRRASCHICQSSFIPEHFLSIDMDSNLGLLISVLALWVVSGVDLIFRGRLLLQWTQCGGFYHYHPLEVSAEACEE